MKRVEFTAICNADAQTTWKHFVAELWLKGAGLTPRMVVEDAGDTTGNGATRWIPVFGRLGIREAITLTQYPEYLQYQVMDLKTSAFPVRHHLGRVDFVPVDGGKTRVVWSIEYTPKPGSGWFVQMIVGYVIPNYLKALERICANPS
ncbi:MAG: SRPBCC family protein [Meiothermus sp.]|nr:SRPBCC family protein [Meiothermus sp.]